MNINVNLDLTDILALWGAVLATVLGIRELLLNSRRVTITCYQGLIGYDMIHVLVVDIRSKSLRPVTVDSVTILLNDGNQIFDPSGWGNRIGAPFELPKKLEDGDNTCVYIPFEQVRELLGKHSADIGFSVTPTRIAVKINGVVRKLRIKRHLKKRLEL